MSDVQIYSPMGQGGSMTGLDKKLLEFASQRMSGEAMYEELGSPPGLSPARCIQRVKEIVQATDYLDEVEQMSLLLLDFVRLRDILWERLEGTETKITKTGEIIEVESAPAWANALVRVLKEWRVTISAMQKAVGDGQMSVSKAHAKMMMEAISVMFDRYQLRLEQHFAQYKTLPTLEERRAIFEEVMPLGFAAIEQKTAA